MGSSQARPRITIQSGERGREGAVMSRNLYVKPSCMTSHSMIKSTIAISGGFMTTRNALVIGGGIAGPVAAVALRRAGIDATVYEAYPTTADSVGAVLSLAPNGIDALDAIGFDATRLGEPVDTMVIAGAD